MYIPENAALGWCFVVACQRWLQSGRSVNVTLQQKSTSSAVKTKIQDEQPKGTV